MNYLRSKYNTIEDIIPKHVLDYYKSININLLEKGVVTHIFDASNMYNEIKESKPKFFKKEDYQIEHYVKILVDLYMIKNSHYYIIKNGSIYDTNTHTLYNITALQAIAGDDTGNKQNTESIIYVGGVLSGRSN